MPKPVKPVNSVVFRTIILEAAETYLTYMKENASASQYDTAFKYQAKAEAMIELLEADDCGSHGGFDTQRGQPPVTTHISGLYTRLMWLKSLKDNS